jgi:hypothetical protein
LQYTADTLSEIVDNPGTYKDWDFFYQASWWLPVQPLKLFFAIGLIIYIAIGAWAVCTGLKINILVSIVGSTICVAGIKMSDHV